VSDCATPKIRFETPTALPLEAAFDGGDTTSDGGRLWLAQADATGHLATNPHKDRREDQRTLHEGVVASGLWASGGAVMVCSFVGLRRRS
jgi:hypothetical protein